MPSPQSLCVSSNLLMGCPTRSHDVDHPVSNLFSGAVHTGSKFTISPDVAQGVRALDVDRPMNRVRPGCSSFSVVHFAMYTTIRRTYKPRGANSPLLLPSAERKTIAK